MARKVTLPAKGTACQFLPASVERSKSPSLESIQRVGGASFFLPSARADMLEAIITPAWAAEAGAVLAARVALAAGAALAEGAAGAGAGAPVLDETSSADFASGLSAAISLPDSASREAGSAFCFVSLDCRRPPVAAFAGPVLTSKRASGAGAGGDSLSKTAGVSRFWLITAGLGAEATRSPAGPGPPRKRAATPAITTIPAATPAQRQADDQDQAREGALTRTCCAASLSGIAHQTTARQLSQAAGWVSNCSRSLAARDCSANAASKSAEGCSPGGFEARNRCAVNFDSSDTPTPLPPRCVLQPSDRRTVWPAFFAPGGREYSPAGRARQPPSTPLPVPT